MRATGVQTLVMAGRRLAEAGISPGTSGNLSMRDGERILITASGADLGRLDEASIAEVGLDGTHRQGPRPSKEVAVHVAMYTRNPGHTATVHVHSPHAVAVACLPPWSEISSVPPITPYFVMRVGQVPLIPYRAPGDPELGTLIAGQPRSFRAALLANHGQVTSGTGMDDALSAAVELEETCRITLLTAGREPRVLSDEAIAELARRSSTAWVPVG